MLKNNKILVILLIINFILFSGCIVSYGVENEVTNENINETTEDDDNTSNQVIENSVKDKQDEIWYNNIDEYLNSLGLTYDNITFHSHSSYSTENGKQTMSSCYIRYEGHIFYDKSYRIYFDDNGAVLKKTYLNNESILPRKDAVVNMYNSLPSSELKKDFNWNSGIYDVFDHFNYCTSLTSLKDFIRRCDLSGAEFDEIIEYIDQFYDRYIKDKKEFEPEKKYSKDQIINVFQEVKRENTQSKDILQTVDTTQDTISNISIQTTENNQNNENITTNDNEENKVYTQEDYNNYISEMLRKNHIEALQSKLKEVEPYTEEYARNMIENDHINKSNVKSKKIVNEIPNSGSEANRYIVVLSGISIISILGIILFVFVQKTKKNSK